MTKELSLVERLLQRAEQTELRAPYADAPASDGLPRMEAMLADATLDREAADALAEQAAVREELYEALRPFARLGDDDVMAAIAKVASPFSFIQFTDNDGGKLHKLELTDLSRARAALAKAAPEKGEAE